MELREILLAEEGPWRTGALAAWFQGLFVTDPPVLVGGAAVELYTRGAYRTGDLDFVGRVPADVARKLAEAGFEPRGRHWLHGEGGVFIELPSPAFDAPVRVDRVRGEGWTVIALSPEDVLVDRLAAWVHWNAVVEGVNAFLLWEDRGRSMDVEHLERRAAQEGVRADLDALRALAERRPDLEEVERWAGRGR